MSVVLTKEQIELLEKLTASLKKDEGLLKHLARILGFTKDEPSLAGLLSMLSTTSAHSLV
jgi:hypothetical protein